jgi:hypothetical protein
MILRRSRHLQIIDLAVQEPCGKEMPVPGGEPGHVDVMTGIQEHAPYAEMPVQGAPPGRRV